MKNRFYLYMIALALGPFSSVSAQSVSSMNAQGNITGTLDGASHKWVTLAGEFDGEHVSTAHWRSMTFSIPDFSKMMEGMEGMAEHLSPEQRAQLDMLKNMDMENNPMAAMLGQLNAQTANDSNSIEVTIMGHDPTASEITSENALVLTVPIDNIDDAVDVTHSAELTYIVETSGKTMPRVLYVSDDESGEASVTFDKLDIQPKGGHATGRFQGSMCRMDMQKIMEGIDTSDCITVEGRFDTTLSEDQHS